MRSAGGRIFCSIIMVLWSHCMISGSGRQWICCRCTPPPRPHGRNWPHWPPPPRRKFAMSCPNKSSSVLAGFTIDPALDARIALLAEKLLGRGWLCATAESCTGGLVGASLTAVSGSSAWFVGGVISYANDVKTGLLGVDAAVLAANGAVSKPVVRQMAAGVCRLTGARAAMAISG